MSMKLSVAMMLGDTLRERNPRTFLSVGNGRTCGCAIGGAVLAVAEPSIDVAIQAVVIWPWLADGYKVGESYRAHIGCDPKVGFDAVCAGKITFEQLVDYVRSVEPDCGECNRFDCTCQPKPVTEPATESVSA